MRPNVLRAVRHPGGNDPLCSRPKQRECRIRDQDDVQKNTGDECSWRSSADGEDNECVDEAHPVTVSAMNAPTPGTTTTSSVNAPNKVDVPGGRAPRPPRRRPIASHQGKACSCNEDRAYPVMKHGSGTNRKNLLADANTTLSSFARISSKPERPYA